MIVYKNGKQQLTIKGHRNRKYIEPREEQLERGRIRKAIEDRKIEKELLNADPW